VKKLAPTAVEVGQVSDLPSVHLAASESGTKTRPTSSRHRRWLAIVFGCVSLVARADNWAPNLTVTGGWDSNATNANRPSDQIDTLQLKADILASQRFGSGRDDSFHLSLHGGGEWFPRYNGLTSGAIGARAEWRHKFGLGPLAPSFSAEVAGDYIAAKETGRRGASTSLTVSARKRFNDVTRGTVSYELARKDARYSVYDRLGREIALELDRDLTEMTRLTFTARYRNGDVVSYATPPRPDLVPIAPDRLAVDSFNRPMIAYSIDANTWSGRVALVRALDERSAVIVGYEYRDTKRSPLRYVNHLVSVALVHQF
jgi:hypothetical protein